MRPAARAPAPACGQSRLPAAWDGLRGVRLAFSRRRRTREARAPARNVSKAAHRPCYNPRERPGAPASP
jgi:hypothetical protein